MLRRILLKLHFHKKNIMNKKYFEFLSIIFIFFSLNKGFSQSYQIDINIDLDRTENQTTWELKDPDGNVLLDGGPYNNQDELIYESYNVNSPGIYTFTIYDTRGNGLALPNNGSDSNGTSGFTIELNGKEIFVSPNAFNFGKSYTVYIYVYDNDLDGVVDQDDIDNDNDGIPDYIEQPPCNNITGNWEVNNDQASSQAGNVNVTFSHTNDSNTSLSYTPNGTFNTTNYWSNSSVAGSNSLEFLFDWDTTPEDSDDDASDDAGTITVTINFSVPVSNPVLHIDRIGGCGANTSNSSEWTLLSPDVDMVRLSGTGQFIVEPTKFYRKPYEYTDCSSSDAAESGEYKTAAGSIMFKGTVQSLTFSVTGIGVEGAGGDELEFIFDSLCPAIDTDNDGYLNYLDLDSDNDGIYDIVEAGNGANDTDHDGMTENAVGNNGLDNNLETDDTENATINYTLPNTDGTANEDYIDIDADDDGIVDNLKHNLQRLIYFPREMIVITMVWMMPMTQTELG